MSMPSEVAPVTSVLSTMPKIVKEGLLYKRGENLKNWRPRYFYLLEDGSLLGFNFKSKPDNPFTSEPLNKFTVKGCQTWKMERPKPYTFAIRGLQPERVVERTFYTNSEQDRMEWLNAIQNVAQLFAMPASPVQPVPVPMETEEPSTSASSLRLSLSGEMESMADGDFDAELFDRFTQHSYTGAPSNFSGRRRVTFENFEFLKVLGKGAYGKVILCREKASRKLYALKVIRKDILNSRKEVNHLLTEKRVLQSTSHPFIISLKCSFQTSDRLCFVTEYVNGGELFFHLSQERVFPEERVRFYAAEIISAIGYLHQNGIIYRDLKLENLLLDSEGHIKLVDFGLCKEGISFGGRTTTFCGTQEYLAPEICKREIRRLVGGLGRDENKINYGQAVDWWSVGVLMYEMMTGRLPFFNSNRETLFELIFTQEVRFPNGLSNEAKDLVWNLLRKDPLQRLGGGPDGVLEIMRHSFFIGLNWDDLYHKRIQPPFKPQVTSDTDTRYFDVLFTAEPVEFTPPPGRNSELGSSITESNFVGFSYRDLSTTLGASYHSMERLRMS